MNISLNWLKEFIDIKDDSNILSEKLTFGGLEVEALKKYNSVPGNMDGIVVGEVMECSKHPNADKLSLTKVDIGEGDLKSIVCGAPNVAAGQKVLIATVGCTIHPTNSQPFTIKKAKIRGEVSEGMICAADELGLGNDHHGILVLDTDLPNGANASQLFSPYQDEIIEIGLTPNRGDASSHLGVARDLKALYHQELKSFIPKSWPEKSEIKKIQVELKNPEACPRYAGILISNLKIGESPNWLKNNLKAIGLNPINNVVDVTNFILHDLGQPLHAFDYDRIKGSKVIVKTGLGKTKFKTLDGEVRELSSEDLMICNETEPMCIGGVFGGADSGVSESTTTIFLESACFDPVFIRKTSLRHGLKTDAAFRFERGTDIDIVVDALKKASNLLAEVAGGNIASEIIDIYPKPQPNTQIDLRKSDIKRLIGIEIPEDIVIKILNDLEIKLISDSEKSWKLDVPKYRTEVYRPSDLIEEILRIYGFNNVPLEKISGSSYLAPKDENDPIILEEAISNQLVGRAYNEIQGNSLTKPDNILIEESFEKGYEAAEIFNKLSEDLGVMRDSLLPSALEAMRHNINRKQSNLRLFEFGYIYSKNRGKYHQKRKLSLAISGNANEDSYRNNSKNDFSELKSAIIGICQRLGITNVEFDINSKSFLENGGYEVKSYGSTMAFLGKASSIVSKKFELSNEVWYAELDIEALSKRRSQKIKFEAISKFPDVRRDLSLVIDKSVKYNEIKELALTKGKELIKTIRIFDVFEGKPLGENQKSYAVSFILQDKHKTLEDKRIDKLMNELILCFEKDLGAIIRR